CELWPAVTAAHWLGIDHDNESPFLATGDFAQGRANQRPGFADRLGGAPLSRVRVPADFPAVGAATATTLREGLAARSQRRVTADRIRLGEDICEVTVALEGLKHEGVRGF